MIPLCNQERCLLCTDTESNQEEDQEGAPTVDPKHGKRTPQPGTLFLHHCTQLCPLLFLPEEGKATTMPFSSSECKKFEETSKHLWNE
jgi:hypothetical protein